MSSPIGFVESLKETSEAMPWLTSILMSIVITAVIVGATAYQVILGNIGLPEALVTFLNSTFNTNVVTILTAVLTALGVIFALLIVVVIIILFRKFIGVGGNKKGGDSF